MILKQEGREIASSSLKNTITELTVYSLNALFLCRSVALAAIIA